MKYCSSGVDQPFAFAPHFFLHLYHVTPWPVTFSFTMSLCKSICLMKTATSTLFLENFFAILMQDLVGVSLHLQLLCDGCWQLRHDLVELSNLISVDHCSLGRVEGHHVALRISSIKLV